MTPTKVVDLFIAIAGLVEQILSQGHDAPAEIRRLARSYDARADAEKEWKKAMKDKFPHAGNHDEPR